MGITRRKFTAAFKAKVALEAIQEHETMAQLAQRHQIHANQIYKWKRELQENAALAFGGAPAREDSGREQDLLMKIGELTVERDFLARGLERLHRR